MPPDPSATRLRISPGLETVTELVLVDGAEHAQTPPIERFAGPRAVRAALVGELLEFRLSEDRNGERECCLELAGRLLDGEMDLAEGLRLTRRALDIEDDEALRRQLVDQLARLGNHGEAAQVLMGGKAAKESANRAKRLTQASGLLARAADARGAEQALLQAASLTPEAPEPKERLAAIHSWAPDQVGIGPAVAAWLTAAELHPPDSDASQLDFARAFDLAPDHGEAAMAYAHSLSRQGRLEAADEVLRGKLAAAELTPEQRQETTRLRVESACRGMAYATALGAAMDSCAWDPPNPNRRDFELARLLKRPAVNAYLGTTTTVRHRLRRGLDAAARTRSPMGRAAALVKLARKLHAEARALILGLAAEAYALAGNARRAVAAAREASQLAPWSPRALATLLSVAPAGELDAGALELAAGMLPVRNSLLQALAAQLQADGKPHLALAWTRRWLVHSGGSAASCRLLLDRAIHADDVELLATAVRDVLGVAIPLGTVSDSLGTAARAMFAKNRDEATKLIRQVVDTVGPGDEAMWRAMAELAVQSGDADLERSLRLRRAASVDTPAAERGRHLLRAAELALSNGSATTAAVHLRAAAAHAADLDRILQLSEEIQQAAADEPEQRQSDCLIALAHADAWAAEQQDTRSAVAAWRRLGAMRWDLAADRLGAEEAYFLACSQEPEAGPYRYAADLYDRAGAADAVAMITGRAERLSTDDQSGLKGRLLAAAGRLAAEQGLFDQALEHSVAAVQCDPFRNDAVAVVEKVADGDDGVRALNLVYDILASSALGRFGVRAAHYRAARQLEQRGAHDDALRHAVSAFEAVPGEGACYALLLRLATRCDDDAAAVRSIASVAASGTPDSRIGWLKRAARLAGRSPQGPELRFDLFVTAFAVDPNAETVELLGEALAELMENSPDDEVLEIRFEHALRAALPRLAGPRGAYTAIALAELSARTLHSGRLSAVALLRAIEVDPHGGGYDPVLSHLPTIVADEQAAVELMGVIRERQRNPYGMDPSLAQFAAELAERLGDRAPPLEQEELEPSPAADPPTAADEAVEPTLALELDASLLAEARATAGTTLPVQAPPTQTSPKADSPDQPPPPEVDDAPVDAPPDRTTPVAPRSHPPVAEPAQSDDRGDSTWNADAEEQARERGDHRAIADILAARARATDDPGQRRYIRLRRAAVLEQRLGLLDEAAAELETILTEVGDDPTSLRYLADLHDRRQRFVDAAALWLRAADAARTAELRLLDLVRSCESQLAAGDGEAARQVFDTMDSLPLSAELLSHRADLAQRLGDPQALADALNQRASLAAGPNDPEIAIRVQAATAPPPRELREISAAARRTPADAEAAPESDEDDDSRATDVAAGTSHAVVEACRLDYRLRGAGTPHEAQRTLEKLTQIAEPLPAAQQDLFAFLYAEALDAVEGEQAAVELLREYVGNASVTALAGVALAERLARLEDPQQAVDLYVTALDGEADFHGVRSRGQIALDASSAAYRLMHDEQAARFLGIAAHEEDTRAAARQRLEEWFSASVPPEAPSSRAGHSEPPVVAAADEAEPTAPSDPPPPQPEPRLASAPPPLEPPAEERESTAEPAEPAPAAVLHVPEVAGLAGSRGSAGAGSRKLRSATLASEPEDDPAPTASGDERAPVPAPAPLPVGSSRPELSGPHVGDLYRELVDGSFQAGEYLIALIDAGVLEGATGELLTVRLHQAAIRKGDPTALARLEEAARLDHNEYYAQAISHVIHAFDTEDSGPVAPSLSELTPQPELTTRLLFTGIGSAVSDALAIVSESGMLRKNMAAYDLSGADRVSVGAGSPLGHAFTMLSGLLDCGGARLFQTSRSGALRYRVALMSPLAAVLDGDAHEETPLLHYVMGAALAATMPSCAIVESQPEPEVRQLLSALVAGFGPVGALTDTTPTQIRLAEDIWHVVPAAAERRLRELCADPLGLTYERALRHARQACRRAGLFASGDLATAVEQTIQELGIEPRGRMGERGGLMELCAEPAIADLVDLAISPEYAEMRWHRQPASVLGRQRIPAR